jgi:DNA-binding transcriptional regulator YiaG
MASKPFHYTACGLDNVFLLNGYKQRATPYGKGFAIQNIDGLHAAIGKRLIREKKTLSGKEIRFLRHEMGLSQSALATLLGVDEQSVARWEKGQAAVSGPADKMIRLLYAESIGTKSEIARMLRQIAELDEHTDRDFLFEATDKAWRAAAAA